MASGNWMARTTLSRRDSLIVARHEVSGLQFGHLQKVMSGILCPEGAGGLSPGFQPWEPTTQSDAP